MVTFDENWLMHKCCDCKFFRRIEYQAAVVLHCIDFVADRYHFDMSFTEH